MGIRIHPIARRWCRHTFPAVAGALALLALASLVLLLGAIRCRTWDAATAYATLFVGLIAADVVVWQGTLAHPTPS